MRNVLPHPEMLPSGASIASSECSRRHISLSIDYTGWFCPSRRDPSRLSCSIGEPAFPSRPGAGRATARSGGDWEERSHPQPRTARCCAASMARMASTGPSPKRAPWHTPAGRGSGVSASIAKRDVTKPAPHSLAPGGACQNGPGLSYTDGIRPADRRGASGLQHRRFPRKPNTR